MRLPSLVALVAGLSFLAQASCSESTNGIPNENANASGGTTGSGGAFGSGGANSGGSPGVGSGGETTTGMSGGGPSSGGATGSGGGDLGSGGGDTGSGGETSQAWSPCPTSEPCKILPLGDSITEGMPQFNGGYRVKLFELAVGDGHDITFTGSFKAGNPPNGPDMVAGQTFPKDHEGVSGAQINAISTQFDNALNVEEPHIVLLHAGTNDLNFNANGADMRLATLVDKITAALPDALLVVSTLIPLPGNGNIAAYNATIEPLVQDRASQGDHVIFVDQFTGFMNSDLEDMVHPTNDGYAKMGTKWYEGIKDYL